MKILGVSKRLKNRGNVVSLFSGAGGMDIGFYLAGFNIVWSNDIDKDAVCTYSKIFKNHKATLGNLTEQKLPSVDDLDLVIGGPPCQGFSVAGKMDPKDPRSQHVWNFLAVVKRLKPKAFVMENVKALAVNTRWKELLENLRDEAKTIGYETQLFVLNASDYGVPQARERMFLIGSKKGNMATPKATTKSSPISVKQILQKMPKYGSLGNDSICTAKITPAKNPILRRSPYAGMLFNGQGRPLNLETPALTLPASMGGNRTPIIEQDLLSNGKISWVESYHKRLLQGADPETTVPKSLRRITVEEAAALQTFPSDMNFEGSQSSRYRQIGNAVPPLLAFHVAKEITKIL